METRTPLNSALFSFFTTGVMPPHPGPRDYEAPRTVSLWPFGKKRDR